MDSRARQSRWLNRAGQRQHRAAGQVEPLAVGAAAEWHRRLAAPPERSSTSQSPSAMAVEKCTVSGEPAAVSSGRLTAAGNVAELFTTTRSPGSNRSGSSVNVWWSARRLRSC